MLLDVIVCDFYMFISFNIDVGVVRWLPARSCVTLIRRCLSVRSCVQSCAEVLGIPVNWSREFWTSPYLMGPLIIGAVHHTAPIEIRYVQFARILLYWTGIPRLKGWLGFTIRPKG